MMSSTDVPHELQAGRDRAHTEIAGALYKRAVDGNIPAQVSILKRKPG
jgi:hypothetical protein